MTETDGFAEFIAAETIELDPDTDAAYLPLTTGQWHTLYARYCTEHGHAPLSVRQVSARLNDLGFMPAPPVTRAHEGVSNTGRLRMGLASRRPAAELEALLGLGGTKGARSTPDAAEVKEHLRAQEAIPAGEFGILYGMAPREVTVAIRDGRLGIPTFQRTPQGTHYVLSRDVVEHFKARGLDLV